CPDYIRLSSHRARNQVPRLMEAHLAPKQSIQLNKITSSCEICNGPHDTQYCMENPKKAFVEYASSYTDKVGENSMAHMNVASVDHHKKEELQSKGIKSPSKLLSSKYLLQASLEEHNMTPSSPKHEVEEESEEEFKEETKEEEEDNPEYFDTFPTVDELRYHEWIPKNPRPPWVNAKIKRET
ncbi:hypothetical protein Tco_1452821, partial [Tanacetum coccineum]